MKRTSPWIFVAGVAVQLAALGLCAWAMERWLGTDALAEPPAGPAAAGPEPAPAPAAAPPWAAPHAPVPNGGAPLFDVAADVAPGPPPVPQPSPPPQSSPAPPPLTVEPPARAAQAPPVPAVEPPAHTTPPGAEPPPERAAQAAYVPEPPPAPRLTPLFGPPPAHAERPPAGVPPFVVEGGDDATQVLRGRIGEGSLVIGIASDGNIRCVDVDGGRYSGLSESARARLREVDGSRAFTVQLGIDGSGALHASFTGGGHDGETIALSPLVEGSAS